MESSTSEKVVGALETFRIELPSWGFANTGTRFGKFIQLAAATTTEEKFSDAGQVHLLTGVCPTVALHVLWDCPEGAQSTDEIRRFDKRTPCSPTGVSKACGIARYFLSVSAGAPCSTRRTASKSQSGFTAGIFPFGLQTVRIIQGLPTFGTARNGLQMH